MEVLQHVANEHVENYTSEDNESIAGNTSVIVWTMKRGLHSLMTMGTSLDKAFCGPKGLFSSLLQWVVVEASTAHYFTVWTECT